MTLNKELAATQIRNGLEQRLAQVLRTDVKNLPTLSLSEIIGVLFSMHGYTNSLGHYGDTINGIRELVGDELFWKRPVKAELEVPAVIQ